MSDEAPPYEAEPERLDQARRRKIAELAGAYRVGMSEMLRKMIAERAKASSSSDGELPSCVSPLPSSKTCRIRTNCPVS